MFCPKCGIENPDDRSICDSKRRGFTLPPVALILLVLLFIMLLTVIPAAIKTPIRMRGQLICQTNLKTLAKAMVDYVDKNDNFPTGSIWCDILIEKTGVETSSFRCGSAKKNSFSYGMNKNLSGLNKQDVQRDVVMLFEIKNGKNVTAGPELLHTGRHNPHGCYIAYINGHVEWIDSKMLNELKWIIEAQ